MTSVEERIDHAAVRDWIDGPLSEWIKEAEDAGAFIGDALWAAQRLRSCRTQMRALLTEHSTREEALRQIQAVAVMAQNHHVTAQDRLRWLGEIENRARAALPATESAQPEPERYVGSPAPPLPQRAERKEEPDMKSLVAWFVQTKLGQKLIGWLFRGTEDM